MKNEDLGYDNFFESNRVKLGLSSFQIARVIAEFKEAYKVKNPEGEYLAKITGKWIFQAEGRTDFPAVGDWVAITPLDKDIAIIHKILPRKTILKRKYSGTNDCQIIATNIDESFIVESVGRDYNLNRYERYITIAIDGGIKPVIILNKIDLISRDELNEKLCEIKNRFQNVDIIPTSTITNEGLGELRKHIEKGKTSGKLHENF